MSTARDIIVNSFRWNDRKFQPWVLIELFWFTQFIRTETSFALIPTGCMRSRVIALVWAQLSNSALVWWTRSSGTKFFCSKLKKCDGCSSVDLESINGSCELKVKLVRTALKIYVKLFAFLEMTYTVMLLVTKHFRFDVVIDLWFSNCRTGHLSCGCLSWQVWTSRYG